MKGVTVNLPPSDVLHIPGLGFDGLVGYSLSLIHIWLRTGFRLALAILD